jgi:transposase
VRAILLERGLIFAKGRSAMARLLPELLRADTEEVSRSMRELLTALWEEWQSIQRHIDNLTNHIESVAQQHEVCRQLTAVPGIGPLAATALVAAVADGSMFKRARDLSAWLGLVPQQRSTGGKTKLVGISKRGNPYLRRLLVLGAQSARLNTDRERHPRLGKWLTQLEQRVHRNTAVVALANKLARIAWTILRLGRQYDPAFNPTAAA